jgi:hypothetical protein
MTTAKADIDDHFAGRICFTIEKKKETVALNGTAVSF